MNGKIGAREIKVTLQNPWPDYVFEKNYKLQSLEKVEQYINKYKHLPNIPSAKELQKEECGLNLAEMQGKQMEKIEELYLYLIEMKKEIEGGDVITALNGFIAENGSNLTIIQNAPCSPPMRIMNQNDFEIDSSSVREYYEENDETTSFNYSLPLTEYNIFPNPSRGNFTLQSSEFTNHAFTFELIDVNGRIINISSSTYFDNGKEKSFVVNDLIPGAYVLKITDEILNHSEYRKIIIQK